MQTPDVVTWVARIANATRISGSSGMMGFVLLSLLLAGGCTKDPALAAMETDAHGYQCQKCGAKVYTGPRVFLESKCPKCQQESLADVIGYWCEKDLRMTIRPKVSGPEGAAVCEQCGAVLKNAMISPKQKDLVAWGATKAGPP